ncbi:MAG: TRAP transporter substrate-binding protein DctP [Planctomycetes bacterium]|nr:TRAP transporter substrate-binding protein DctP [Planctomycetota bacterium]
MKTSMNTLAMAAFAFALLFAATVYGADGKRYTLTMTGQDAEGLPSTNAMHKIADEVKARTDGKVRIKVYPSNQLGEAKLQYQGIMDGSIDMMLGYLDPTYSQAFDVTTIPFLASNYDEIAYIASKESNCYKLFEENCAATDMVFLGFFLNGVNGIFSVKDLGDYQDPDARKTALIRIANSVTYKMGIEAMGYPTVTIPWPDTYTSLQTGVMDGMTGIPSYMVDQNFGDIAKYFLPLDMFMETNAILISPVTRDSLPKEYMDIIQQVVDEVSAESLKTTEANVNAGIESLRAKNVTILPFSNEDRDRVARRVREKTAGALLDYFGKDILDKVQEDIANAGKAR